MNNKIAIQLTNVSKKYEIHHEKPTLVEKFVKGRKEQFTAINNISLTIKKGEFVGIIGPNGSGKTTLLKIVAGITTPTKGCVQTKGRVISLIDLEAGFHPDLTGIQNIYLNGILLGMSKDQITREIPSIIDFADIHQFIDVPLFTYSSGMKLRLGFAIAVHSNPDVLVLDESIGVGDKKFQNTSLKKIHQFFHKGKTIIVASHWFTYIKQNCERVLVMEKGRIKNDGTIHSIGANEW
ncbi:MAG: ABC transporter ATP-binding protein [Candidatus Gottesmanbacteria bacterium]